MAEDYIVAYLHQIGQSLFQEAQRLAPDSTGKLKKSGSLALTNTGFEITYAVPYAYSLHEGGHAQEPLTTNWVSKIPRHRRRTKGKMVTVKAHTKTYKEGFKPVPILEHGKSQAGGGILGSSERGQAGGFQDAGVFTAGGSEEVEDWMTLNMNIRKRRPDRPWIQQAWERISRNDPMAKSIRSIRNMIIKNPNGSLSLIMNG
jgi:hypothetical protein